MKNNKWCDTHFFCLIGIHWRALLQCGVLKHFVMLLFNTMHTQFNTTIHLLKGHCHGILNCLATYKTVLQLQRSKNTKEIIANQKGTKLGKDGED